LGWLFLLLGLAMPAGLNSRGKKREKLNYMHANPVKRGLVNHPRDWAWSSCAYYFGGEKPLLPMDV
jgi:hypothetical protein